MRDIAPGVRQIALTPRNGVNVYVLGDVLVDAGLSSSAKKIVKELGDHRITELALTHAHLDHAGGARGVCDALGIPLAVGANDVEAIESGRAVTGASKLEPVMQRVNRWKPVTVGRPLREGDEIGDFTVIDSPGHSPGHLAYWRASDRTLVCGDVWFNLHPLTTAVGLHLPPDLVTVDPGLNRRSALKLAALEPETVLFGHGPPLLGAAPRLREFMQSL
jgi:glyoxylase-like metal-dependent hydrolase (beta-lactamase superfamily II)